MLQSIQNRLEKTAQFIERHPTATACVLTAAISWKLSHDITLAGVLEETSEMAYEWGRENGVMQMRLAVLYDFVDTKDLKDELQQFIFTLKD